MSNQEQKPDWSIKPDSTHWGSSHLSSVGVFYKKVGESFFVASDLTGLEWEKSVIGFHYIESLGLLIERPTINQQLTVPVVNQEFTTEKVACSKMEPTTWDGQGLPPVGTKCELHLAGGRNAIVEITAIGKKTVLFIEVGSEDERQEYIHGNFRPLKTDRERWIEAVREAMEEQTSLIVCDFQLGIIYDAGLAKLPEQPQ